MPDEKISQMPVDVGPILGTDILPIVGNTTTTPTNYRVAVANFFALIQIALPQTTVSALTISANVTANANTSIQAAGEFDIVANSSMSTTAMDRIGLITRNLIQNGNSNITGQFAISRFTLDTGNSVTSNANTYGMMIQHWSNTAPRFTAPRAYFAIQEDANTGTPTLYLMDIGAQGNFVSGNTSSVNTSVILSEVGSASASHTLKINVNGTDMWVLCSNVAP